MQKLISGYADSSNLQGCIPDFQCYPFKGNWISRVVNFHLSSTFLIPVITKLQDKIDSSYTSPVKKLATRRAELLFPSTN